MSEQQFQAEVMDELRQQQENDMETTNRFQELFEKNVNDRTEARNGLTYLSWSWAWAEFKKFYPNAHYEVAKTAQGLPYFESDAGAMVYTVVTAGGCTHEMWLPVMDGANKAMKKEGYTYKTKFGEKSVEAFSMFDVNKTIMRCLTKNLAMFGLGLYIYSGDDLPTVEFDTTPLVDKIKTATTMAELQEYFTSSLSACGQHKDAQAVVIATKDSMKAKLGSK